ncbi:MAG: ribonuclease PH [Acidobacteria bacterium]|nr:ribonuclease PH [Acidobacteriota bacterium]
MRPVRITPNYNRYAEGSCLMEMGETKVICTASVEDRVPLFLRNTNRGWVTAEYSMLPRATDQRTARESSKGGPSGRTQEIQRLIGRSLRAVAAMNKLGERTITVDCDVIQADGGTRTAAVTGGFVALALALKRLQDEGKLSVLPLSDHVAAVSVGIVGGNVLLDLEYAEDSKADVDMNIVKTGAGLFVEVQGTAESGPFSKEQMAAMMELAGAGIDKLVAAQADVFDAAGIRIGLAGLMRKG